MPFTFNGLGTSVCGSRGKLSGKSFDAMEWFVVAFMPIVPIKAVHTFDWHGVEYRALPLRWSLDLVLRTFLARWALGVGLAGAMVLAIPLITIDTMGFKPVWLAVGLPMILLAVAVGLLLHFTDRRHRDIRRVLGEMTIGTADPAFLTDKSLDEMAGEPRMAYGTDTFAEAVEKLLEQGS